jgi:hypothetical protein
MYAWMEPLRPLLASEAPGELALALDLGLELMLDAKLEAQLDAELRLCPAMEPELALGPVEGPGPLFFDNDCRL